MKNRARNPRLRGTRVNPLKLDPTRTTTLRREAIADVRRRFARLALALDELIVRQDSFGLRERRPFDPLKTNAFCPTGPGGGIDNSCSPGDGSVSSVAVSSRLIEKSDGLYTVSASSDDKEMGQVSFKIKETIDEEGRSIRVAKVEGNAAMHSEFRGKGLSKHLYKEALRHAKNLGADVWESASAMVPETVSTYKRLGARFVPNIPDVVFKMGPGLRPGEIRGGVYRIPLDNTTTNVFCPTGEGGGVDPRCGASEGEGTFVRVMAKERGGSAKSEVKIGVDQSASMISAMIWSSRGKNKGWGKGLLYDGKIYAWPESDSESSHHGSVAEALGLPAPKFGREGYKKLYFRQGFDEPLEVRAEHRADAEFVKSKLKNVVVVNVGKFTTNERWELKSSPEQLVAFQEWLKKQLRWYVVGMTEDQLWARYVQEGFRKGAGRAFDDLRSKRGPTFRSGDFLQGERRQFLSSSFRRPETVEKVKILASRTFEELNNVGEEIRLKLGRVLTDGLARGDNPRVIAREMRDRLAIPQRRAETIARTEIIRAHAEGQLSAMEDLGVDEVGVMVEWSTAGDDRVCFPAGVTVKTDRGDVPIETVTTSDRVLTRKGYKRVLDTSKRDYDGRFSTVAWDSGSVTCTSNHRLWTDNRGWVRADRLVLGDVLDTGSDDRSEVRGVVDHVLRQTDDQDSSASQNRVSPLVLRRVGVPVRAVAFDRYAQGRDVEVDTISSDLLLADEVVLHRGQQLAHFGLDGRLSARSSVTLEGAVPSIAFGARRNSEDFAARQASNANGRSSTLFGAVLDEDSTGEVRRLDVNSVVARHTLSPLASLATLPRAVVHSVLPGGGHHELLAARDARLLDDRRPSQVAGAGAVLPAAGLGGRGSVDHLLADDARDVASDLPALGVATMRAELVDGLHSDARSKRPLAERALVQKRHRENPRHGSSFIIPVYCLKVEDEPEFYANGVLVHNCEACSPMEGVVLKLEEAHGMIPRHPNCRCSFIPANVGESRKEQVRGKTKIERQIDLSARLAGDAFDQGIEIDRNRPRALVSPTR